MLSNKLTNFQATLVKFKSRIQSLKTSHAKTERDLEGFKKALKFLIKKTVIKASKNVPSLLTRRRATRTPRAESKSQKIRSDIWRHTRGDSWLESYN